MIRPLLIGTALVLTLSLGVFPVGGQEENVPEVVRTRLEEAQRHQRAGRLDEAVARAEEALELGPQVVEVYLTLGALHHARGDLAASLQTFERGLAQSAEDRGLLYNAAVLALRMEKPGQALEYTERALKRNRSDAQLLAVKSSALVRLDRLDDAFAALEKAWKQDRKNPRLLFRLGNLNHQFGRSEEAIEAYRRALREDPEMGRAHYNLGAVLFEMERYEEALGAYQVALAELEEAYAAGRVVDVIHARAFANLGAIYLRQGDNLKALAAYDTALDLDASIAAGIQASRGYLLFQLSRFGDSLEAYEVAVAEGGVSPLAYLHLGQIHHQRGDFGQSVVRLEEGLGKFEVEDQPLVFKLLALNQQELGGVAQAEIAWREFLNRMPEDLGGLFSLGRLLRRSDRGEEARPFLELILGLAPDHLGATLELASLAQADGRRDDERRLYETALADAAVGSGLWPVRLRLALLLLRSGEIKEARHHLDALAVGAMERGDLGVEEQHLVSTLRGLLLVREGDRAGARRVFATVAAQESTSAAAQAEALLSANEGDATVAVRRLEQALPANPTALERANLGQLLWSFERFTAARPHLEAAAADLPSWPSLRASLGQMALREGRFAEASTAFEAASALCSGGAPSGGVPTGPAAPSGVLTTFLYGDRSASLCSWIEQSLGRALLGVAFEEMPTAVRRGGEALRAVRLRVDRALATDLPSGLKAVAFFVRGTTALAGGDSAAALRDLSTALRAGLSLPLRPLAENNLGVALARSGRGEEARARWMAARTATPSPPEASLNVGIFLDEQGGRGEEALAFFEEYLHSKGPRSSEVTAWADRLVRIFR